MEKKHLELITLFMLNFIAVSHHVLFMFPVCVYTNVAVSKLLWALSLESLIRKMELLTYFMQIVWTFALKLEW